MFSRITFGTTLAIACLIGSLSFTQSASAQSGINKALIHGHGGLNHDDFGHDGWDEGYGVGHCTKYRTIVTYVYKQVPVKQKVLMYRPCGTPYYTWKVYYKTIKVPVYKKVPIHGGYGFDAGIGYGGY
ncbi:MAG TPA: hypothetical protein PKD64_04305 [Pirellulaceae bacterium]|nr:hypothetical protein [Pirellulaceae bacterium]HMO91395.1 hypothetical protein [Pirellulaceae bacterium]HMP69620.1 hypothetical protein [Pirellulaceae bacterium]